MSAGEVRENYDAIQESMRRGFAVGAPARRSRDGNGKIAAPVGPVTGRAVSRSEMEADLRPTSAVRGQKPPFDTRMEHAGSIPALVNWRRQ